ncbi:BTAD domain-containing putative transcriptional regulator [Spirillospora sp. CA-294931]|uniref:AfsR/SARP family transcriptional regulator n=1 Tax=Spirillospora sp. CA-294931 TaxID=3240042 RepID=UPI003D92B3BE
MLLRHGNRTVSVDVLVDALWDGRPPRSAQSNLRVYAHHLRRALGADDRLVWESPGYRLRVCQGELDAHRFEDLLARGRDARRGGDLLATSTLLREAHSLWRGPAYEGLADSPHLADEAERLAELHLAAIEERLSADLDLGRHRDLVPELRTLTAEHPLREPFCALLVLALYRSARQAEALEAYQEARGTLVAELGVEPGPQLRALHQAILEEDPGLDTARSLVSVPEAARAEPPALAPPRQLPLDVSMFTGREAELARLDRLLPRPEEPADMVIASVSGTAGVGKTALAVHWAHRVGDHFPDGLLFTDLCGFGSTGRPARVEDVLNGFLRALGVPPAAIPLPLEERAALFRTRLNGRRVLIVLDNAATSGQVRWLLPGSPGCRVVVTSRNRMSGLMAREGAHDVPVDLLSLADALALLRRVTRPELVDTEPEAAVELARRCAFLPLALRLAAELAALRPGFTMAELTRELAGTRDRLALLAAADDETTTVREALSWSYEVLDPQTARAFRLLGLHPGQDISLAAAAALFNAGGTRTAELLAALTRVHLIQETARGRYRFHDLLKDYAADRADADEPREGRQAALRRLLTWYLHSALAVDRVLMPWRRRVPVDPPDPVCEVAVLESAGAAVKWCETERLNMMAVADHAARTGHDEVAWKLPFTLWSYFYVSTRWDDWIASHHLALQVARRSGERYGESLLLTSLANAHREIHRHDEAFDRFHEAIALSQEIGEPWVEAAARTLLCMSHRDLRQHDAAFGHGRAALKIFAKIGDPWGRAWALHQLGETYADVPRNDEAVDHLRQALTLFGEIDDRMGRSRVLSILGRIHRNRGRFEEAAGYARQALAVARELGSRQSEASALYTLGDVQYDTGQLPAARRSWGHALAIFEQLGAPQAAKVRERIRQAR